MWLLEGSCATPATAETMLVRVGVGSCLIAGATPTGFLVEQLIGMGFAPYNPPLLCPAEYHRCQIALRPLMPTRRGVRRYFRVTIDHSCQRL